MSDEAQTPDTQPPAGPLPPGPPQPEGEGGPLERDREFASERFAVLQPKLPESHLRGARGPEVEQAQEQAVVPPDYRQNVVEEFRRRQAEQRRQRGPATRAAARGGKEAGGTEGEEELPPEPELPMAPAPPPANNWIPIGPSVLRKGQAGNRPATSGRVASLAIAPGGARMYVASSNGGVWRSEDEGLTWRSLMDAFDLNPTIRAADSLSCGAIAIVPGDPDRIYVGTGEGNSSLAAFVGVGPVVSIDGGQNWITESVAPGSPDLAGGAFFALAVDPANPERVVAATRSGLYRREPDGRGGFQWAQKNMGGATFQIVTSVVVTRRDGVTTFYAANQGGRVYWSNDGESWNISGGFPSTNIGLIGLAVQPDNPAVIYALVCRSDNYHLHGVYRMDIHDGMWRAISGAPPTLFGADLSQLGQGWYDLAIAVDPGNVNRIYLGGATVLSSGDWSGALYRCEVTVNGANVTMVPTFIGDSVHSDIHALVFAPGDAGKLWVGCDGGVFYSTNPTGTGDIFLARNTGLATLSINYLEPHPTEDAVLFCGTQDNGCVRYTGEEAWLHSAPGDGGFAVINWANPYQILSSYTYGTIRRSLDGGTRGSYSPANVPISAGESILFYAPLEGAPYNPAHPKEADIVAFGSIRPWLSQDFGTTWKSIPSGALASDSLNGTIKCLEFASASKLYAGTIYGGVYRFDQSGTSWARTQIDRMGGPNSQLLYGPVTDIAIDPADPSGNSIYVTMGGAGDFRHVWHFDGRQWQARSGPTAGDVNSLLDVQTNAIVVDPANPGHLYIGADIGVWRSMDSGATWQVFSEGLPDAAVLDLKLHAARRLIQAGTHGRSVFERTLDDLTRPAIELYVRDTRLDLGRRPTVDGLPDPTVVGHVVEHWRGPDVMLDTPDVNGQYLATPSATIDFLQFTDVLSDEPRPTATQAVETTTTRAYVQVHNRGIQPADGVQVMLLVTPPAAALPPLPAGYESLVQSGTPITSDHWRTAGVVTLNDVRPGAPKIAAFDLPANPLPPAPNPGGNNHPCVLALLHHPGDAFTPQATSLNELSVSDRKVAQKNLTMIQYSNVSGPAMPIVLAVRLNNPYSPDEKPAWRTRLEIDLSSIQQRVRIFVPGLSFSPSPAGQVGAGGRSARRTRILLPAVFGGTSPSQPVEVQVEGATVGQDFDDYRAWANAQLDRIAANQASPHPYDRTWSQQHVQEINHALDQAVMLVAVPGARVTIRGIVLQPGEYRAVFLMFDPPTTDAPSTALPVEIRQLDDESGVVAGGLSARVENVAAA